MKTTVKACLVAVLALVWLCFAVPGVAAEGGVVYSGNAGQFIFAPGSAYSPTDMFPNFKDVMPGDMVTQEITVRNDADNRVKVNIYLRSLGADDEMSRAFLSQLQMTVTKAQDTPMFKAAADQTAGLTDWVCLGTLYSGGEVDLTVTLTVPTSLDTVMQKRIGYFTWEFMVEELPVEKDDPVAPKTGEMVPCLPFVLLAVGVAALFVLVRRKRKGEEG